MTRTCFFCFIVVVDCCCFIVVVDRCCFIVAVDCCCCAAVFCLFVVVLLWPNHGACMGKLNELQVQYRGWGGRQRTIFNLFSSTQQLVNPLNNQLVFKHETARNSSRASTSGTGQHLLY